MCFAPNKVKALRRSREMRQGAGVEGLRLIIESVSHIKIIKNQINHNNNNNLYHIALTWMNKNHASQMHRLLSISTACYISHGN